MTKTYKVTGTASFHRVTPSYEFESQYRANSKMWIEQVKEIEKKTGEHYTEYETNRGGYLYVGTITRR